ncbi:unnamed protein product [Phytophthora lilii]|uniref:Unnamed protein product n=1 Tax=Phytophthora lilii TaxID=2077276 RepID=A0A9W6WVR0_9STRA|nr:unnamed protein product [Phytophthora lilii]
MYQPCFQWIKGEDNAVADFISRNPDWKEDTSTISLAELLKHVGDDSDKNDISTHLYAQRPSDQPSQTIQQQCRNLYENDPYFGPIWQRLTNQSPVSSSLSLPKTARLENFEVRDALLYYYSQAEQR